MLPVLRDGIVPVALDGGHGERAELIHDLGRVRAAPHHVTHAPHRVAAQGEHVIERRTQRGQVGVQVGEHGDAH